MYHTSMVIYLRSTLLWKNHTCRVNDRLINVPKTKENNIRNNWWYAAVVVVDDKDDEEKGGGGGRGRIVVFHPTFPEILHWASY